MFSPNRKEEIKKMRKEWIRLFHEIQKKPGGKKWFMLYSIYYNQIANKDFVKKIYSGAIPDSNIPQFMEKLTRRFENVEHVKPIENSIKLMRRIKPNNVYEIRNKWRKKGAPVSRPTIFSTNKDRERRNYTTHYPPGWFKIVPHSKITARNIVKQTQPPPPPVKNSAWLRLFDPRRGVKNMFKDMHELSSR
jgi:hypothetical protein